MECDNDCDWKSIISEWESKIVSTFNGRMYRTAWNDFFLVLLSHEKHHSTRKHLWNIISNSSLLTARVNNLFIGSVNQRNLQHLINMLFGSNLFEYFLLCHSCIEIDVFEIRDQAWNYWSQWGMNSMHGIRFYFQSNAITFCWTTDQICWSIALNLNSNSLELIRRKPSPLIYICIYLSSNRTR